MVKHLKLAKELALPPDVVTQKINVLGQSGGGKTYTAMKLAELMLEQLAQIVAIDLVGVWHGLLSSADGLSAGFSILVIGGEHGHLPLTPGSGAMVADLVVDRGVSVVLDVSELLHEEMVAFLADFLGQLFHRKKKNKSPLHVFFEEAQELFSETPSTKAEFRLRSVGVRLCKIGRNFGIGYTTITQEPQSTSKRVLNQAGTIIAVRTIGEHERKAIAGTARSKATSKEQLNLIDVLPELETGEAIVWSPAWLKFAGKVRVLPKVTFDSSKTPEVGEAPREPKVLAPVEIEQFRTAMAAAVAEAEASDPTALQRRVRELEAQLATRPAPKPEVVEVPVFDEKQRAALIEVEHQILEVNRALRELQAAVEARKAAPPFKDLLATHRRPVSNGSGGHAVPIPGEIKTGSPIVPVMKLRPNAPKLEGTGLKRGARDMLRELAALHPRSLTRRQLATRVIMAHDGGSTGDYISALVTAGFAEKDDAGDYRATPAGLKAAGAVTPKSDGEIIALWQQKPEFKRGVRAMLDVMRASGPGTTWFSREQLAEAAGMEPSGGSVGDYISALVASGCADAKNPRGGPYQIGHALFLGGRR
jgi:hypothetical protein